MMQQTTLLNEIRHGESRILEFKKELPEDSLKWVKSVVAFANGAGGRIIIGVDDNRKIFGISKDIDIFELKDKITDIISQMCSPQVMYDVYQENVSDKIVMVVEVFPGNNSPYHIKSMGIPKGTFIRLGATTRVADEIVLDELKLRGKRKYYDETPFSEIQVEDKDVRKLCAEFSKMSGKRITKENLVNMKILLKNRGKYIATKAYAIFIGKFDSFVKIQCARFKGTSRVVFLDKRDFDGSLLSQVEEAYQFVLKHINLEAGIRGLRRQESYELPEAVIRELILNAIIHRNYMLSSCVQVAVYDDRVEISSPGTLFGSLTLEEALKGRSSIRNRIIAGACEKLGIVEGWGTGLVRVLEICKQKQIRPPEFQELGDLLRINFYRPSFKEENRLHKTPVSQIAPRKCRANAEKVPCKCPVNAEKIYTAILENPKPTNKELCVITGLSDRAVRNQIKILKDLNLIIRIGSDKSGYWEIVRE